MNTDPGSAIEHPVKVFIYIDVSVESPTANWVASPCLSTVSSKITFFPFQLLCFYLHNNHEILREGGPPSPLFYIQYTVTRFCYWLNAVLSPQVQFWWGTCRSTVEPRTQTEPSLWPCWTTTITGWSWTRHGRGSSSTAPDEFWIGMWAWDWDWTW